MDKVPFILNQRRTGKKCPRKVQELRNAIPEGSLICYVKVHALTLATVLDRLVALEDYQQQVLRATSGMRKHRSVG